MSPRETPSHSTGARRAAAVVTLSLLALVVSAAPAVHAQSFQVLHAFTGQEDGSAPESGLTVDAAGKFYGTASGLGSNGNGSVFKLTSGGSGWVLAPLNARLESGGPGTAIAIGPNGNLFGTSDMGGGGDCLGNGCGLVYRLQPPSHACSSFLCTWNETVLYRFNNVPDAGVPAGSVVFDHEGNLYGTTEVGGTGVCIEDGFNFGCGAVYKLTPSSGGWTETLLYSFQGGSDGEGPEGGLIFDASGNLYGSTAGGGSASCGTIFELSPSDGGWTETILHTFQCSDGAGPWGNLITDQSGNLYGVTTGGGANNGGVVYELSQPGSWTYNLLYGSFPDNSAPAGTLAFDGAGNLYGTTRAGGAFGDGTAYKLTPSNGSWTETDLHDFQTTDGVLPNGGLVVDSAGNLYGTAEAGGIGFDGPCYAIGCGTVWEITP